MRGVVLAVPRIDADRDVERQDAEVGVKKCSLKSAADRPRRNAVHRICSASSNASDTSIGTVRTSGNSAHCASRYGLIVGFSSVTASLIRVYPFMWLSGT